MRKDFVQIVADHFEVNGKPLLLRGYSLGSWMNLEHFMMGLPGTHSMIHEAFTRVYGAQNAAAFFDSLMNEMVAEADIAFLKSMGTNALRIPFGYHYFIDDLNPSQCLADGFVQLDRVIRLCEKYEIYAILDLHSTPGGQNNDWHSDNATGQSLFWKYKCFQIQICDLWGKIAKRYANQPWVAGYDLLNEPGYGLTREAFNGFYNDALCAIRKSDPNHVVFLEGDDFGRSFELFDEPQDPQVTYALHFYPFVLEENVLDPTLPENIRTEIFERIFYRQLKMREKFHRPLWCGESGYNIPEEQEEFCAQLLRKNISLCENNNLSWSLWSYKDARRMGIVVPRMDSDWMRMRKQMEVHWNHEWEQEISMMITRMIGQQYNQPLSDALAYDLDFRVRSILHRIAVEQILIPNLCQISWEEMRRYPQSFAFANCDRRECVIDAVSDFLG